MAFGFPTQLQWSFFLVIVLLGLSSGSTTRLAIWTAVATVSILAHELGHAFAARRLGADPGIELYGFGGLTWWEPRTEASRWDMISVAMAGPAVGLVFGALLALGVRLADLDFTGDAHFAVFVVLWINIGWGLVNLLPVLPLDGGHIMSELLPGTREQRVTRAAWVSVVTGGAAAIALLAYGLPFGAMVFGWAVATNITRLRAPKVAERSRELDAEVQEVLGGLGRRTDGMVDRALVVAPRLGVRQQAFKAVAVEAAASAGDARGARRLMDELPGPVPPAIYALVAVTETGGIEGVDELREIFTRDPDPVHGRWLAIGLHRAGRVPDLVGIVAGVPESQRTAPMIAAVADMAAWSGHAQVAGALRSLPVSAT